MKFKECFFAFLLLLAGCVPGGKKDVSQDASAKAVGVVDSVQGKIIMDFERLTPPAMMTEPQERAAFMLMHFWDKFDFRDTMYCYSQKITEQAFVDFLTLLPYVPYDIAYDAIKKLIKGAEVDGVMFAYFCRQAEHYLYEANSPYRNDEYFIPFLEEMVVSNYLSDAQKVRPAYLLVLAHQNRPGHKANDVEYTLASGKTGRLHNVKAQYILLLFYNPGCHECQQTMGYIKNSAEITAHIQEGKLKVVAIYPDENIDAWRKHVNDVPAGWINGYDGRHALRQNETYDLKAIPTLYLLDSEKKVLLKDTSVGTINHFLNNN